MTATRSQLEIREYARLIRAECANRPCSGLTVAQHDCSCITRAIDFAAAALAAPTTPREESSNG